MTAYDGAVSITSKQGYRLSMGPVTTPERGQRRGWRKTYLGSQWRATFDNGWGPPCFHSSVEAAIDCLEKRISEALRP